MQEIWALALWVERTHRERIERFIAERITHFEAMGSPQAMELWDQVARRYEQLREHS